MTAGQSERVEATIGLGSNIGAKAANIGQAIGLLTAQGDITLVAQSRLYRSAPWGVVDQDWFVNAAIRVSTSLPPLDLLGRCQAVEIDMGRVRLRRWGERVIDVDILTYDDRVIAEPTLAVPHPLIAARAFVLRPLLDVAPDLRIDGLPIATLLSRIDASGVIALEG